MAAKKKNPSKAEQALASKELEYQNAKVKANHDKATDADKKAYIAKKAEVETLRAEVAKENFIRVAKLRTNKAIKAVKAMGAVFSPGYYLYTKAQGEKMITAVGECVADLNVKLEISLRDGPKEKKAEGEFEFE